MPKENLLNKFGFLSTLKILGYGAAIALGLLTKNPVATFFALAFLVLWDRKLILPVLLITPLIETVLIVQTGLTVTKLLSVFFIALFVSELVFSNKFNLDGKTLSLLAFLIVVSIGSVNALLTGEYLMSELWDGDILGEFLIVQAPKVIFAMLLYQYFRSKGMRFLFDSLNTSVYSLSLALIIIGIYFFTIGNESITWWNVATRLKFEGADPNEFSGMFVALGIFPLYLCLVDKSRIGLLIGSGSFLIVCYAVILTLSRGGFLALTFASALALLVSFKQNRRRAFAFTSILLILFSFLYFSGLLDLVPLYERFLGTHVEDLSSFSAGRTDFIKSGLSSLLQRPILGYGGTAFTSRWVNYLSLGKYAVMHSIYLEILVQYGILGFFAFLIILFQAFSGLPYLRRIRPINSSTMLLYAPYLSLVTLLFVGLALSWQWREIVWYFIGLSLVTSSLSKRNLSPKLQR